MVIVILLNILIAQLSYTYAEAKKMAKLQYDIDRVLIVTRLEHSRFSIFVSITNLLRLGIDLCTALANRVSMRSEYFSDWVSISALLRSGIKKYTSLHDRKSISAFHRSAIDQYTSPIGLRSVLCAHLYFSLSSHYTFLNPCILYGYITVQNFLERAHQFLVCNLRGWSEVRAHYPWICSPQPVFLVVSGQHLESTSADHKEGRLWSRTRSTPSPSAFLLDMFKTYCEMSMRSKNG